MAHTLVQTGGDLLLALVPDYGVADGRVFRMHDGGVAEVAHGEGLEVGKLVIGKEKAAGLEHGGDICQREALFKGAVVHEYVGGDDQVEFLGVGKTEALRDDVDVSGVERKHGLRGNLDGSGL